MKLIAWPNRYVKSGSRGGPTFEMGDALEVLSLGYSTDAHFVPYWVEGASTCPRLLKTETAGVVLQLVVLDLDDAHAHAGDGRASEAFHDLVVEAAEALSERLGCDVGWYTTLGGGRLLVQLPEPVEPAVYLDILARCRKALDQDDFVADELVDWTRCYRLPDVVRDGAGDFTAEMDLNWGVVPREWLSERIVEHIFAGLGERAGRFEMPEVVPAGRRNQTMARLAGKLRHEGEDEEGILFALEEANERCEPPLPPEELVAITASICQYPAGPRVEGEGHGGGVIRFELGDEVEMAKVALTMIEQRAGEPWELFEPTVHDRGALWQYDPDRGVWAELPVRRVYDIVQGFSGDLIAGGVDAQGQPRLRKMRVSNSMTDSVRSLVHKRRSEPGFFNDASAGLSFSDGYIGADSGELVPHRPGQRARVAVPCSYMDAGEPELWSRTLREIFAPDDDAEQKIKLLYEYMGTGLLGAAPRLQKALVLQGSGANGKSLVVDVLGALFRYCGTRVGAVTPQDMHQEYARDMLQGVRLNAVSEMPEGKLFEAGPVKAIITGDLIVARPIREAPYTYRPEALHVFSANTLPPVSDSSDGFWRRWDAITFNRVFSDDEKDHRRADQIIEVDLAAIAVRAVQHGVGALKAGRYTQIGSSVDAMALWRMAADPVAQWLSDRCVVVDLKGEHDQTIKGSGSGASRLYSNYVSWCSNTGHRAASLHKFGRRLGDLGVAKSKRTKGMVYGLTIEAKLHVAQ